MQFNNIDQQARVSNYKSRIINARFEKAITNKEFKNQKLLEFANQVILNLNSAKAATLLNTSIDPFVIVRNQGFTFMVSIDEFGLFKITHNKSKAKKTKTESFSPPIALRFVIEHGFWYF